MACPSLVSCCLIRKSALPDLSKGDGFGRAMSSSGSFRSSGSVRCQLRERDAGLPSTEVPNKFKRNRLPLREGEGHGRQHRCGYMHVAHENGSPGGHWKMNQHRKAAAAKWSGVPQPGSDRPLSFRGKKTHSSQGTPANFIPSQPS